MKRDGKRYWQDKSIQEMRKDRKRRENGNIRDIKRDGKRNTKTRRWFIGIMLPPILFPRLSVPCLKILLN